MTPNANITLDIGFAVCDLFDDYIVVTIHEGVVFDAQELHKIHEILNIHYTNKPVGYISNRLNDYTINPNCYKENDKYDTNIVGVATLCYSEVSFKTSQFAEQFIKYPHKAFYTMEECQDWIKKLL